MKIVLTTLSIGENYTRDYTCRLIDDVLNLSNIDIYITTDFPKIILDKFENNRRIHLNYINRDDYKISLPIGQDKFSSDFNFNLRHICLLPLVDLDNTVVIFTDCDNSFDWYDEQKVKEFISQKYYKENYDFFGPRNDYKWKQFLSNYKQNKDGIFKHKIFNYDIDIDKQTEWNESPLPAEYLLIFVNNNGKLKKFYEKWKWFYEYLNKKEYTEGTWAEGFEIGVSSLVAGFKPFDIGWNHPLWSKMLVASGYKSGHRGNIHHKTER